MPISFMSDQSDDMSDQMVVWPDMSDHCKKVIIASVVDWKSTETSWSSAQSITIILHL